MEERGGTTRGGGKNEGIRLKLYKLGWANGVESTGRWHGGRISEHGEMHGGAVGVFPRDGVLVLVECTAVGAGASDGRFAAGRAMLPEIVVRVVVFGRGDVKTAARVIQMHPRLSEKPTKIHSGLFQ